MFEICFICSEEQRTALEMHISLIIFINSMYWNTLKICSQEKSWRGMQKVFELLNFLAAFTGCCTENMQRFYLAVDNKTKISIEN